MEKVFISFCRAGENIIEQIIKNNICSEFIHVEILTDDFAYDYSEQHGVEGKKRWNLIERMESESYKRNINEVFELNIPKDGLQKVYSFIEKYYQTHNYDKNMKVYKIGDLGLGNKEFIKGNLDITTTICSHFCFEVIRFIVENYYKENTSLIHKVGQINNHYKKKMEYITPGHLYKIFSKEDGFFLNKTETYKKNMEGKEKLNVELIIDTNIADVDFEKAIYHLQQQIDNMSSQADKMDYFVSVASGILCAMLDILWVGEFSLENGKNIADKNVNMLVIKIAKLVGCKDNDLKRSVSYLEKMFPILSDGNTFDFGGGLQHHLRDFAHHPTIIGLIFSLLTQFSGNAYGTDVDGNFKIVSVSERSKMFIGEDIPDKIIKGTVIWFFHLVSDIAGSKVTTGLSGGTGIPGPILAVAKELSVLPFIKEIKVNSDSLSVFLSKIFNGTLFAKYDKNGKIIKESITKLDFRGELGFETEIAKQAIPVVANECIVRFFYFIRRLICEIKEKDIKNLKDFNKIEQDNIMPSNNPTLTRMLIISTGVFSTIDITSAIITKKYLVSVNYIGVGQFTVALSMEMVGFLKVRKVKDIKHMYEKIEKNTYNQTDNRIYERLSDDTVNLDKFGLTLEQTEILYNLEYLKVLNDIRKTSLPISHNKIISLKKEWINDWKKYMKTGFSSFVDLKNAELHWYSENELRELIKKNQPKKP